MKTDQSIGSVVGPLVAIKVVVHLSIIGRYGYHGDELYFIQCGQHLAAGYVDHAPLVPWLARLAGAFDHALWTLRLPSIAAGAGAMVLVAVIVRDLGGRRGAQLLAGLAMLVAPAYLRMATMLNIPAIELLWWTAGTALVVRIVRTGASRLWLAVGVVAGVGLLTKHSLLLWGAGLVVGLLATPERRQLRTRWPWLGFVLTVLIVLPNVVWQVQHGWPTLEFLSNLRASLATRVPRALFLAGQLLYLHPLAAPLWLTGLWFFLRGDGRPHRFIGVAFLFALAALLLTAGKPYYLAPAYPPLFAGGAVLVERKLARFRAALPSYAVALGLTGVALSIVTLPLMPITDIEAVLERSLGSIVPPIALTHDLHAEIGWPEHARAIREVAEGLDEEERAVALVLTDNYSKAAALDFYGPRHGLPPAASGHLTYFLWGPPEGRGAVAIAYGLDQETLENFYADVREVGWLDAPGARPGETDLPIYACRRPRAPISTWWPELRRFRNGR